MGFFDGTSSSPDVSYPPSAPAASGTPSPVPSYQDYLAAVNKAAALNSAQAPQHPGLAGLYSWMSGGQRDAAQANAALAAPDNYFKTLTGQAGAQDKQLDVGQVLSFMNRFRQAQGQPPVDPNNIPGAFAPQGQPGAQPQAPSAPPQMGAPSGPPAQTPPVASPNAGGMPAMPGPPPMPGAQLLPPNAGPNAQPPVNPADALRSQYVGMANSMIGLPKFATQALDYTKLAREGLPAGTVPLSNGQVADAINGKTINSDVGTLAAVRAGQTAGAEARAKLPSELASQNNQAANTFSDVTDANGNKQPISNLDLRKQQAGGSPLNRGPADNPYRVAQIKQTTDAQTAANDATTMQANVDQLGGAIKQFGTSGPWANHALTALKTLNQAGLLDDATSKKVAAGELANMDSNSVAAGMARQMTQGGRMLAGVFNQVVKNKPSLLTSNPALALEALHQDTQRTKDYGQFAADYYADHKNATKLDAQSAFDRANPIEKYQSRVMPLAKPANGKFQSGYAYQMKDGGTGVFTGTGFKKYQGLGQ